MGPPHYESKKHLKAMSNGNCKNKDGKVVVAWQWEDARGWYDVFEDGDAPYKKRKLDQSLANMNLDDESEEEEEFSQASGSEAEDIDPNDAP